MIVKIRKSNIIDLDNIFILHNLCFSFNDRWYKNAISQYIDNSLVIEYNNNIIGILLQGNFIPLTNKEILINKLDNESLNKEVYGIVMLCIHPNYRNKGLASKLINIHINLDKNHNNFYLCTRINNTSAIELYKKNGYIHIGNIKDKYYLPAEDGYLMIYNKKK